MVRYTYPLKDYRSWLKGLGRYLNTPVVEKKLQLPPHLADGYLYASAINPDISYLNSAYDFVSGIPTGSQGQDDFFVDENFQFTTTPEPSALGLVAVGIATLLVRYRRFAA